jgi:Flp pilus assembly protein TadB
MVRVVLKYVYLVVGTALAMAAAVGKEQQVDEKADPDDDGVEERDEQAIRRREEQKLRRRGEARSPMDAATYRANELVRRPIRTVLLFLGYEALFVGVAVCVAHTDTVASTVGSSLAPVVEMIGEQGTSVLPAWLLPVLVPAAVGLGLVFTFVFHQSLKVAGDIRRSSV